ncbi:MAG TPA: PKD domain-containing protein [Chthoniobacterales bacterium]
MSCSDFALTVDFSGGPDPDPTKQVTVTVNWPVATADFDVYVYAGSPAMGSPIATSASSADPEVVVLPAQSAVYTIRVVPFAPAGQTYTATASITSVTPPPPPGNAPPPRYFNYPAPASATGADSAGEPSIGVDWNPNVASLKDGPNPPTAGNPPMNNINLNTGGVAFFTANLNQFRVDFDDCASPAKNAWTDVTSPTEGVETLDPIGFVDHQLPTSSGIESGTGLGRVFQDQLAGATSLLAYSDDDGGTYTQSQGSGQPAGVDHQTVGAGPYNDSAVPPPPPHPLYPHQVYYASQDVGTAFAARSDDGGLTFGPGVPMWNITQCGGLHGHIKVGPDGTVYVPNKSCTDGTIPTMGASVAVSRDNGLTWTIKEIHEGSYVAGSGDTDPSVGIGADNTLYVGYQNSDGHAHIAVSTDHGDTWHDVDVGQGVVENSVFPEVVAGDGDRAAFGFLGTSTAGGYQGTDTFTGVWYYYIATTFDRGQTYTLVDATNGDPVQIGSICTGGTTCGGDRNLLDFNDIQLDAEGRVVAAYADGCVGPACTAATAGAHAPPYNESRSALATVIRQSGGPRLLSAFDSEANCSGSGGSLACAETVPAAPRVDQVVRTGVLVHLDWSTPDDGGSPLTGYHVYRKTGETGTYAIIATVTTGCPNCKRSYDDDTATDPDAQYFYKVTALNAQGESNSCGEFPVAQAGMQETACALPGITTLTDPTGDELDMVPGHDAQSLQIAEPFSFAPNKVVFTLKMQSLAVLPPDTEWPVTFNGADNVNYTVRMTNSPVDGYVSGPPLFQVGPTGGTLAPADPASNYSTDGTITIVVPRSAIGSPAVGQMLTGFLTRIAANLVGITITPDNMPDSLAPTGSYTIVGNAACAPNTAPIAAFIAYPAGSSPGTPPQGDPPLAIHFDASASHDPDPGDTIATYHFNFGDGSSLDSASPMVDHTYTRNGVFQARLTVTDSRGLISSNVATDEIEVETPLDDVVSRKAHGSAGNFDIDLFPNPSTGAVNVECRREGNGYLIVFTFGSEFTVTGNASSATVSNGGTVAGHGPGPNPHQYQVMLTGVTNALSHNITLNGVPVHNSNASANGGNATLNDVVARMDLLVGDTNNDRITNGVDVSQTKSRSGETVGGSNFRSDVNVDGTLSGVDVSLVKSQSGNSLP